MSLNRNKDLYLSQDTIAALSSALGGAVAIVRMSGPQAFIAAEELLPRSSNKGKRQAARLYREEIFDFLGQAQLDDALVGFFPNPNSFTGEDLVEFHIHGSHSIASRLLENLEKLKVRQALPGEFSFRAVRNGKMSLSQAQALPDLISAENENAVSLALEKLSGSQSKLVLEIAKSLKSLCMFGEVGIDFSDQDVEELSLPRLKQKLQSVLETLKGLKESYGRGSKIQDGIRVALVGLPNAGKSSLFNALLGEDRSIVSVVPGTTRDVVREKLTLKNGSASVTLRLEDTAGLRGLKNNTQDVVEKIGIERTFQAAREAEFILLVVDSQVQVALDSELIEIWEKLGAPREKTIGVLTKSDKVDHVNKEQFKIFGINEWWSTSAKTGNGIHELANGIVGFCQKWVSRRPGEVVLTRLDHHRAVVEAITHLERAQDASGLDLFAADIRHALRSLDILIGETVPDDILGQIFSEFCIGK